MFSDGDAAAVWKASRTRLPGVMTIRKCRPEAGSAGHIPRRMEWFVPNPPSRDPPSPRWWASGIWTTGPSVVKASDLWVGSRTRSGKASDP